MSQPTLQPRHAAPADPDLAAQARPGHGVPSQDPDAGAQVPLPAAEADRRARSVMMGGGVVAGMATGAAIGATVAGPVGVLVGASLGAAAGALGGAAAGTSAAPAQPGLAAAVHADTVHLHIEDSGGSGRPVVLIHGWPLSAQAWAPQVAVLREAGYRVVADDRRGFGRSDKPASGYGHDTLADDLQRVMDQCGLQDATLVGFSMGGGEVARYIARHGESRLRSVVFASAVTPYLLQTAGNPDGPLTPEKAKDKSAAFEHDRGAYFDPFTTAFFSSDGVLQVTLPTLVVHGEADAIVPIAGSGHRTHQAVPHSQLVTMRGAPHGLNVSHASAFNDALLTFLRD